MTVERHLALQELTLVPSGEWAPRNDGWLVLRIAEGAAYWLTPNGVQELNTGYVLATPGGPGGQLRASSLGSVRIQFFVIRPQLLNGVLAMADCRQLEAAAASPGPALICPASHALAQKFTTLTTQPGRSSLNIRCRLLQIWAEAIAGLLHDAAQSEDAGDLRHRFRHLLTEISQAELASCSLADLAGQLHCSERHLSRMFREEFGLPFRVQQTELRLMRARQILADSNAKIINVAYESGYRHLGLFNTMFKKRFGMTPSQWREKAARKNLSLIGLTVGLLATLLASNQASGQSTNLPARIPVLYLGTPASREAIAGARQALHRKISELNAETNGTATNQADGKQQRFEVRNYEVRGNTLLKKETLEEIFADGKGTNVTLAQIQKSLAALQSAYRDRGYATVAVTLPQQQLTNATVIVQVVEAPITSITVINNHHFSSNNIMRALPSLQPINTWTNLLLNSQVFQRELDLANANRDRQIYPILGPGPDVGTSELTLKVKDRLSLHGRFELNNQYTPGTPPLRMNLNAQYGNLWNLEHQLGLQYSFTPEQLKDSSIYQSTFFDEPLVANYSAFYRMPLGEVESVAEQIDANPVKFGYSEVTHQFQLPPASGRPDLTFYASRSTSDTGVKFQPASIVAQTPLITIVSQDSGEDVTLNEALGGSLSVPLPEAGGIRTTVSLGMDFKRYRHRSFNTNNFYITTVVTNSSGAQIIKDTVSSGQPTRFQTVDYLPLNVGLNFALPDEMGTTFLNVGVNFNPLPVFSGDDDFARASTNGAGIAKADYVKVIAGISREIKIYRDWSVLVHADGQWADGSLINNEQFALGGSGSVRGYLDGEAYGDSGWRVQIEPHTPMVNLGMIDGTVPLLVRGSVFMDYGQVLQSTRTPGVPDQKAFWGVGFGLTAAIGDHLDARLILGCPLLDDKQGSSRAGETHVYFGLGAQF
jgi:hemolysin activation/secretion protein/AraC-like DNA-binding protein